MILTANRFWVPPYLGRKSRSRSRSQSRLRSVVVRSSCNGHQIGVGGKKEKLEALWDDGHGVKSGKDFLKLAKDMDFVKPGEDGGPPRWFCPVSCGAPFKDSPLLLYLSGLDGLGLGLIMHEKALGKVFEVRSLHIPVQDRTPLEDLIKVVEESVRVEHGLSPKKPIYLVGDSFGSCLLLAVAARNPTIDLVIILANPATSFERSRLPTLLSRLQSLPTLLYGALTSIYLRGLGDMLPKDALIWRLKLLRSAAIYANSHLSAVTAEVLVLASYRDKLLDSKDEAQRLAKSLNNCEIYFLQGKNQNILLESDCNLLTIIKGASKYRRTSYHDSVEDYLPPSISEYQRESKGHWWYQVAVSPVMHSTLEDGKIVRGLEGVPREGPVLFVGNHMLMGLDLFLLFLQFLKQKRITLRGLGHPQNLTAHDSVHLYYSVLLRVFGMIPVTPINIFKLFSAKSHVLLYPGGAREALHRKGEAHKLFWPEQQEFVRMAAKFGATIVPFGAVGEDDVSEMIMDYNDMMAIPPLKNNLQELNKNSILLRQDEEGEVGNQQLHLPLVIPKIPGRFYYLFGKPIRTKGLEKVLNDKENSQALYLQIKREVEKNIAYLIKKREEDPYRGLLKRVIYQAKTKTPWDQVPTFEP